MQDSIVAQLEDVYMRGGSCLQELIKKLQIILK